MVELIRFLMIYKSNFNEEPKKFDLEKKENQKNEVLLSFSDVDAAEGGKILPQEHQTMSLSHIIEINDVSRLDNLDETVAMNPAQVRPSARNVKARNNVDEIEMIGTANLK